MPLLETKGAASAQGFGLTLQQAAANYIEECFSCFLYTGNGSTQTITNGIDLSTKGGLVWTKSRSNITFHDWEDTVRGAGNSIYSNSTNASDYSASRITTFNSNGYTLGSIEPNANNVTYASWTFREQAKFFDVVTYTGNGVNGRSIAHNLQSVPGVIFIKATSASSSWFALCRKSNGDYVRGASIYNFALNSSEQWENYASSSLQTNSTVFYPSDVRPDANNETNTNGVTYVAYLFAHNAGGFGLTGTDNVISCGSFTTDGSGVATVNLGYEPQWLLFKFNSTDSWKVFDNMRGMSQTNWNELNPNTSGAEVARTNQSDLNIRPSATGFTITWSPQASRDCIYIAIRRGPMKTPTTGTSVFYPQTVAQTDTPDSTGVPFPPDLVNTFSRNGTDRSSAYDNFLFVDRLRGLGTPNNTYSASGPGLISSSTNAEIPAGSGGAYVQLKADSQNITRGGGWNSTLYGNWIYYFMRRAPGFFDVVCYTGTGANRTVTHNLGVAPELMITKRRDAVGSWSVYAESVGAEFSAPLDFNSPFTSRPTYWNSTAPTSTSFALGTSSVTNSSGNTFVWYGFASCPGVSKVGSYTGTGALQTINCGFTGGARFVLIRAVGTGDWFVYDSARGITSGSDPYLLLNSTAAEVTGTNYVDTTSVGFQVTAAASTTLNVNGNSYIFLAIA